MVQLRRHHTCRLVACAAGLKVGDDLANRSSTFVHRARYVVFPILGEHAFVGVRVERIERRDVTCDELFDLGPVQ